MRHLFLLSLVVGLAGCPGPGPGPGPVIGGAVIDCLGDSRPQIDALLAELAPLVMLQRPDWSAIYQRAKLAGRNVGGCVIAELVQGYLGGTRTPEPAEGWNAHETLETFRAKEAGGATFLAKCTRQDGTQQSCKL